MQATATRSLAVTRVIAIVIMGMAMTGGAIFAIDTYQRGWSAGAIAAMAVALLAGVCAGIGRAVRRPLLERAAGIIAFTSVVIGLATAAYHALV